MQSGTRRRVRCSTGILAASAMATAVWSRGFVGISAPQRLAATSRSASAVDAETLDVEPVMINESSAGDVADDTVGGWAEGRFPGVKTNLIPAAPVEDPMFVDEAEMRQKNTFSIPEEDLVQLAKAFLLDQFSCDNAARPRMAPDFRFVAPVVPAFGDGLSGEELCNALGQFKLQDAVPDLNPQQYDFRTDPFEPNRVWFTARGCGTNTGPVFGVLPATGKRYEAPPQTNSLTFNELGEVTKFTIGYVMDKTVGTTGGLGGIFGVLYGIGYGLPFPEAQPWQPSPLYRAISKGGNFVRNLGNLAR